MNIVALCAFGGRLLIVPAFSNRIALLLTVLGFGTALGGRFRNIGRLFCFCGLTFRFKANRFVRLIPGTGQSSFGRRPVGKFLNGAVGEFVVFLQHFGHRHFGCWFHLGSPLSWSLHVE
jgi:hypothetical protein